MIHLMSNTPDTIARFEPADASGQAYLVGFRYCDCEGTGCDDCEGGEIRVELLGADAEAAYRAHCREVIARCYEQAAKAIMLARMYQLEQHGPGRRDAMCVARVRELRNQVRDLRAEMRGAA